MKHGAGAGETREKLPEGRLAGQGMGAGLPERARKEPGANCAGTACRRANSPAVPHAFWSNYPSALNRMKDPDDQTWYATGFCALPAEHALGVPAVGVGRGGLLHAGGLCLRLSGFSGPRICSSRVTLAVMMVPFPATMVPLFDVFRSLGWVGTFKPLWAPAWFGGAFLHLSAAPVLPGPAQRPAGRRAH